MRPETERLIVEISAYFATGTVAQEFAQAVASVAGEVVGYEVQAFSDLVGFASDPLVLAQEWVRLSGDRFYGMAEQSWEWVRDLLELDYSVAEIRTALGHLYENMRTTRAGVIARTEVQGATNFSAWSVYDEAGFPFKGWVAMLDDKTRDSHASTHGQVRPMTQAFDVNGVQMMYPGDPTAPAREVVNCRCMMIPEQSSRSMWPRQNVNRLWMAYLRRSGAWEDKMKTTVTSQFTKQYDHIQGILARYG